MLKSSRAADESTRVEVGRFTLDTSCVGVGVEVPMDEVGETDRCASGEALLELLARGTAPTRQRVDENGGSAPVVVPLPVRGGAVGAVVPCERLDQKSGLSELGHQLIGLLASHAATAWTCSRPAPAAHATPHPNPGSTERSTSH